MTHTHTQSPWHLGKRAGNPAIYGKDGAEIAEILHELTPEWRENARLIAAAPELLAALEDAEFLLRKAGLIAGPMQDSFKRSATDAIAAIAKATA